MELNVENLEYINIEDALGRIGGNMDLYKRLLGRFLDGNYLEPLNNALSGGDKEEAARLAHTLKGVCANLSLVKLRTLTTEVEQLIKDNKDCSSHLEELKRAYDTTAEKIAEITG